MDLVLSGNFLWAFFSPTGHGSLSLATMAYEMTFHVFCPNLASLTHWQQRNFRSSGYLYRLKEATGYPSPPFSPPPPVHSGGRNAINTQGTRGPGC